MEEEEYTSGVETLSRLCDEQGLQHWDSEAPACDTYVFIDKAGNPHECWDSPNEMVNVVISMTPEQAIQLGETCHDKNGFDLDTGFECTSCGAMVDSYMVTPLDTGHMRQFAYCPFCGKAVAQ